MKEGMGSEGTRVKQCWHHGTVCFQVAVVFLFLFISVLFWKVLLCIICHHSSSDSIPA